jgi:hypothetical protein
MSSFGNREEITAVCIVQMKDGELEECSQDIELSIQTKAIIYQAVE